MKPKTSFAVILGMMILVSGVSLSAESWKELLDRADSLSKAENQDSAIIIGALALEMTKAELGGNDTATARALHQLALFHYNNADFDKGLTEPAPWVHSYANYSNFSHRLSPFKCISNLALALGRTELPS